MSELRLANAKVVTPAAVVAGEVLVRDGGIAALGEGRQVAAGALDLDGDYLLPGLVEIHTDNLEKHLRPRPDVRWPVGPAVAAHDAQMATAGITTVFDALTLGSTQRNGVRTRMMTEAAAAISAAEQAGELRAQHFLHLRCEVTCGDMPEAFAGLVQNPLVQLVSLMDHTPGQRQWSDLEKYRTYNRGKLGLTDRQLDELTAQRREDQARYAVENRRWLLDQLKAHPLPVATHDDTTPTDIDDAVAAGSRISEFPTTVEAAELARRHGMHIVMGAPNIILGGSHSGNVSAGELAARSLLDILSSDYVPASLLEAVWQLHRDVGIALPQAVAMASATAANSVGLGDRGRIAIGQRADLIQVRVGSSGPVVRAAWRAGVRIA